jgi:hypothetical protein
LDIDKKDMQKALYAFFKDERERIEKYEVESFNNLDKKKGNLKKK